MNSKNSLKLTNDIVLQDKKVFVIRIDKEAAFFIKNEEDAKTIMDSISEHEKRRLEDEWTKVYKKTEGEKIILSTQKLGRVYNGYIIPVMTIDYIPICEGTLADKPPMYNIPIPSPDVLEGIAKRRSQVVNKPEEKELSSSDEEDSFF